MVEILDKADRSEAVEVIAKAFSDHPHMPPDPTGRRPRQMIANLLNTFAKAPNAKLFGIRRDGQLHCAAFVYDANYEPGGFALILFLLRMVRALGWKMSRAFLQIVAEKLKSQEHQLELLLLGTRTDCQQQGLGRMMLHHILEYARRQGYQSVVLEVAKETPALGLYLREGFVLEKEIALPMMPLCLLRCPLSENGNK